MGNIDLELHMEDGDADMFKRCVRYLLRHTCIMECMKPKLYNFAERYANEQALSDYFAAMGFAFDVHRQDKLCLIKQSEEDQDIPELQRMNLIPGSYSRHFVDLALWQIYEEKRPVGAEVYTTLDELVDKLKAWNVDKKLDSNKLANALKELSEHMAVHFEGEYGTEGFRMQILPFIRYLRDEQMCIEELENLACGAGEDSEGQKLEDMDENVTEGESDDEEEEL